MNNSSAPSHVQRIFYRTKFNAIAVIFFGICISVYVLLMLQTTFSSSRNANTFPSAALPSSSSEFEWPQLPKLKADFPVKVVVDSTMNEPLVPPLDSTPACPKWEAFDKRVQLAKDFSDNCRTLDSQTPEFKLSLCESLSFCGQGYFLVSRTDSSVCKKALERIVSHNQFLDAYLKQHFGPDSFQIIFDGPERATPSYFAHLGNCEYKLPFRLTNTGQFRVQLIHTYDNFKAVDEVIQDVWPEPVFRQLLSTEFRLDVCPHCHRFSSKQLSDSVNAKLPVCGRQEPLQGVYLRMSNETLRERYKLDMYGQPYIWEPLGCKFNQLFELGENSTCHSNGGGKSIFFIGDSQARMLAWSLDRRLSGSKEPLVDPRTTYGIPLDRKYKDPVKMGESRLKFEYQEHLQWFVDVNAFKSWDENLALNGAEIQIMDFDTIVFNLAHWPSSGLHQGGHFSVERFVDMLEYVTNFMETIRRRRLETGKKPQQFIWMGVFGFTVKTDREHKHAKAKDWRINARLKVWSEYAEQVMRRKGITMLNGFDITLPWTQDSLDGAHFHALPAMDAQIDELLHKINICREEKN